MKIVRIRLIRSRDSKTVHRGCSSRNIDDTVRNSNDKKTQQRLPPIGHDALLY